MDKGQSSKDVQSIHLMMKIILIISIGTIILISANTLNNGLKSNQNLNQEQFAQTYKTVRALENQVNQSSRTFNLFTIPGLKELRLQVPAFSLINPKTAKTNIIPESKSPAPIKQTENIVDILQNLSLQSNNTIPPQKSVVQILCKAPTSGATGSIKYISSSGFIISSSGLILTNAHVGIHPFLNKYTNSNVSCTARYGSPALNPISLELIYISPQWTKRHIGETDGIFSLDSGEQDVAILKTSVNLKETDLYPATISNINKGILNIQALSEFDDNLINGDKITLIAYPIIGTPTNLIKQTESLFVDYMYPIGTSGHLIQTSISNTGKSGASGGPIFDVHNQVVGMAANIIKSGNATKIHAIDIPHINATLLVDTGLSLYEITHGSENELIKTFESRIKGQVLNDLTTKK